jgi:hypothetical protein
MRDAVDQALEPSHRLRAVLFLFAEFLRLEHEHAVGGDALVAQRQQPLLDIGRQRRRRDVEAKVNRARHLVDVLAAGALRAHRGHLDFFGAYGDRGFGSAHRVSVGRFSRAKRRLARTGWLVRFWSL